MCQALNRCLEKLYSQNLLFRRQKMTTSSGAQRLKTTNLKSSKGGAAAPPAGDLQSIAEDISVQIRQRHMPYGTIMDPIFSSPDSDVIASYTRTGDSAIWTGHYLA